MDHKMLREIPKRVSDRVSTYVTRKSESAEETDALAMVVFVAAIASLIVACCYVVSRLSRERAYHDKWSDYNDCGWA